MLTLVCGRPLLLLLCTTVGLDDAIERWHFWQLLAIETRLHEAKVSRRQLEEHLAYLNQAHVEQEGKRVRPGACVRDCAGPIKSP